MVGWASAVVVFALALRLAFIWETHSDPGFRNPAPGMDVQVTWDAARAIRDGGPEPNFELMSLSAPLYPYWLAAQQAILGESITVNRIATAVLASLRYALLFFLIFRVTALIWPALITVALLAVLPSLIFFDTSLLKASLDLSLLTLLLCATVAYDHKGRASSAAKIGLLCGALLGLACLSQLRMVVLAIPIVGFAWLHSRAAWRSALVFTAVLAASALVITKGGLSLARASHPDHFLSRAGLELRIGFNEDSDGFYTNVGMPGTLPGHAFDSRLLAEVEAGRRMSFAEADRWHTERARSFVAEDPWKAVGLTARKALLSLSTFEAKSEDSLDHLKSKSRALRWSPISFGILLMLAALGSWELALARRWRVLALMGGTVLTIIASMCLTHVNWRYRVPAAIPLAVLAGLGLPGLVAFVARALRDRAGLVRAAAGRIAVLGLAALITYFPVDAAARRGQLLKARNNEVDSRRAQQARYLLGDIAPNDRLAQAKWLTALGEHSAAFQRLDAALAMAPVSDRWANGQYVRYLIQLNRYPEAASFMDELGRRSPEQRDALLGDKGLFGQVLRRFVSP